MLDEVNTHVYRDEFVPKSLKEGTVDEEQHQKPQEKKQLSFSISRILSDTDDKKSSASETSHDYDNAYRVPKLHVATVHHFAPETEHYNQFESQVKTRACSTPENEYPSPTPPSPRPRPHTSSVFRPLHSSQHTYQRHYYRHVPYVKPQMDILRTQDSLEDQTSRNVTPEPVSDTSPSVGNNYIPEQSSDKSLDSLGESYHQSPSPFKAKKKKTRTVFSRSQVYQLEAAFDMKRYLSSAERAGLAASLNLSETQIKIWFQNRRNKWKRQINGEMDEIPIPPAFAASYLHSAYPTPSLNSYSHVTDMRDDLLRNSLKVPAYYSHPYAHEKLHQPFL